MCVCVCVRARARVCVCVRVCVRDREREGEREEGGEEGMGGCYGLFVPTARGGHVRLRCAHPPGDGTQHVHTLTWQPVWLAAPFVCVIS